MPTANRKSTKFTNDDVYSMVTSRIIESLHAGTVPWRMPFTSKYTARLPTNLKSRKSYRGMNTFLLMTAGFECPYWLSYKQAFDMGGNVKRGEKSSLVTLWKFLKTGQTDANGKDKTLPLLRYFRVFNFTQCEGIELPKWAQSEAVADLKFSCKPACEKIIKGYVGGPKIIKGERASYRPSSDEISMPDKKSFVSVDAYYSTLFHEMTHSTGHASRLNRDLQNGFGSDEYSKEELIAEMGASFLNATAGVVTEFEQSAAYIKGWLSKFEGDDKFVMQAAGLAQKASDHILGYTYQEEELKNDDSDDE